MVYHFCIQILCAITLLSVSFLMVYQLVFVYQNALFNKQPFFCFFMRIVEYSVTW